MRRDGEGLGLYKKAFISRDLDRRVSNQATQQHTKRERERKRATHAGARYLLRKTENCDIR